MDEEYLKKLIDECTPSENIIMKIPKIIKHPDETIEEYIKRFQKFVEDNDVQKEDDLYVVIKNK